MSPLIALARHGQHDNNVLTDKGSRECELSATYLAEALQSNGITHVVMVTSEEPRAVQSGVIYARTFSNAGIRVTELGPNPKLNLPAGINLIGKGDPTRNIPPHGQGMSPAWKQAGEIQGVEPYNHVGERVVSGLFMSEVGPETVRLGVFHGGSIEPAADALINREIGDVPSGGVVIIDTHTRSFTIYNPTNEI